MTRLFFAAVAGAAALSTVAAVAGEASGASWVQPATASGSALVRVVETQPEPAARLPATATAEAGAKDLEPSPEKEPGPGSTKPRGPQAGLSGAKPAEPTPEPVLKPTAEPADGSGARVKPIGGQAPTAPGLR